MDLLALATQDGQVAVHRLAWNPSSMQQLWNVTPEATVTALCWKPDGKILAVGHSDGVLTLLDVENGDASGRQALHVSPVLAISWVDGVAT
jgi:anaphase-promoting complex subunit 4